MQMFDTKSNDMKKLKANAVEIILNRVNELFYNSQVPDTVKQRENRQNIGKLVNELMKQFNGRSTKQTISDPTALRMQFEYYTKYVIEGIRIARVLFIDFDKYQARINTITDQQRDTLQSMLNYVGELRQIQNICALKLEHIENLFKIYKLFTEKLSDPQNMGVNAGKMVQQNPAMGMVTCPPEMRSPSNMQMVQGYMPGMIQNPNGQIVSPAGSAMRSPAASQMRSPAGSAMRSPAIAQMRSPAGSATRSPANAQMRSPANAQMRQQTGAMTQTMDAQAKQKIEAPPCDQNAKGEMIKKMFYCVRNDCSVFFSSPRQNQF